MYYVYVFSDPRTNGPFTYGKLAFPYRPFYVGAGTNGRANPRLKRNGFVNRKVKLIYDSGNEPHVYKYYVKSKDKAMRLELRLIKLIGRRDRETGPLLNLCNGGYGSEDHDQIVSEETKRKISKSLKGRILSPESIERMRQSLTGRKATPEHIKNMSRALIGHEVRPETRKKIGAANQIAQRGNSNRACVAYLIQYPDGRCRIIKNLAKFCRKRDFPLITFMRALECERTEITKGKLKGFCIERLSN